MQNSPILQKAIPKEVRDAARNPLPRMRPVVGPWLRFDEVYAEQMALRRHLISEQRQDVIGETSSAKGALVECLQVVLDALPTDLFLVGAGSVTCPDGACVALDWGDPLPVLGKILQQDICLLQKQGDEHVLSAAVLCFPASWTLAEKLGRPMTGIHDPVTPYDAGIAARVQRLLDGIRPDAPFWRANWLEYDDPALFQPRPEADPRPVGGEVSQYLRSEHQTLLRLLESGAVVFAIHTMVAQRD